MSRRCPTTGARRCGCRWGSEPEVRARPGIVAILAILAIFAIFALRAAWRGYDDRPRTTDLVRVGVANYLLPEDATVGFVRDGQRGYIRFSTTGDRNKPNRATIRFMYEGEFAAVVAAYPERYEGAPAVRSLKWGAVRRGLVLVRKPWGVAICNPGNAKVGLFLQCGVSLTEAGALWQVVFDPRWLRTDTDMIAKARQILRAMQRDGAPVAAI